MLDSQSALIEKINRLRRERGALILAHSYQSAEVQDIADLVGDSLELSRAAAREDRARCIIFCGVHFMAETARILRPERPVHMPDPNAGCPLADMITARELAELRKAHPEALVVTYVNSTAEIKAQSDVCCTSANAAQVVNSLPPDREIIFIPDRNLGGWVAEQTGRKNMVIWRGFCPTHNRILERDVQEARAAHPGALVVAHPECRPEVRKLADQIASTSGMVRFCRESPAREFIIGTEVGMVWRLGRECPGKRFYPVSELADCPNMKLTTLEKILWELEEMSHPVEVPAEVAERARRPLEKMVEILGT